MRATAFAPAPARVVGPLPAAPSRTLRRACACGGTPGLDGECDACRARRLGLRRRAAGPAAPATAPAIVDGVLRSPGQPLDPATRAFMEPRFGYDFGRVRIHTDARAAQSARAVDALAYTVGQNVVFGTGRYAPSSVAGRHLLAHELAHVVQQHGSVGDGPLTVGPPGDTFERSADAAAAAVAGDRAAGGSSRPAPGAAGPVVPSSAPAGPILQRQSAPPVHTAPASSAVPSEKWREDVQAAYSQAGFSEAANAVAACRQFGQCQKLLTTKEAWEAYRSGRLTAGLGEPPEKRPGPGFPSANGVAVAGAAPALSGGAAGSTPAVSGGAAGSAGRTTVPAIERARTAWFQRGASAAEATAARGATAGTAGTVATVAVPVAVGVYLTLAVIDLVAYARFEIAVRKLGYIILPDPLGVCIQNCHRAPAPTTQPRIPFPIQPLDPRLLDDWLKSSGPQTGPTPTAPPVGQPVPAPDPQQRPRPSAPDVILLLPPQKAVHAPRYRALIRGRQLVHQVGNPRTQNAQADRWDRALRPPRGINQRTWDLFEAMGVSELRRLRPNWSRTTLNVPMEVDHVVELQVCPPNQDEIWDSFANYELLDRPSNGSSGPQLAANIRAERVRLAALTGNPAWLVVDLVFSQLAVMPGPSGERWQADEIQLGQHYDVLRRLLGETR